MLKAGERAAEFTLPDDTGTDRSLTELLTTGTIILYFYPAHFTPGCTRQARALRDLHLEIQRAGLRVVGISPQTRNRMPDFAKNTACPSRCSPMNTRPSSKCTGSMARWGSACAGPPT